MRNLKDGSFYIHGYVQGDKTELRGEERSQTSSRGESDKLKAARYTTVGRDVDEIGPTSQPPPSYRTPAIQEVAVLGLPGAARSEEGT